MPLNYGKKIRKHYFNKRYDLYMILLNVKKKDYILQQSLQTSENIFLKSISQGNL